MTRLANIVPFDRISAGLLVVTLEQACPDLFKWSQSGAAGTIAPRQLAALILRALPAAFDVAIEDLDADPWRQSRDGKDAAIINRPHIDILSPDGVRQWTLPLFLKISGPAADPDPGAGKSVPAMLELSIGDTAGPGQQPLLVTSVNIVRSTQIKR